MAFGYAFLLMIMSEVLPVIAPLILTVAFFVPFMERRSFLALVLIQSAYTTLTMFIYRDALRAAFLGVDAFILMAYAFIAPVCLLTGNLAVLHIPDPLLLATGIMGMLASCVIIIIVEDWFIVLLMRKVGFYRRIGKICPREWSIWQGRP